MQIIEKFKGGGYNDCGGTNEVMSRMRQQNEDRIIKIMRVVYPYGLNSKVKKDNVRGGDESIGSIFPPLSRTGVRPVRSRIGRNNRESAISCEDFFDGVRICLDDNIRTSFDCIRKILNQTKKKVLKCIASRIMLQSDLLYKMAEYHQWYEYILDIIDTKLYKPPIIKNKYIKRNVCVVDYENKGLDDINLAKIFRNREIVQMLPNKLLMEDNIPLVTYRLGPTIRNKIFNYKETVESIMVSNVDCINIPECDCLNSQFCDGDLGHIITGKLNIVENKKLRKLLQKGPNYREPKCYNYGKCVKAITKALDNFIYSIINKYKMEECTFNLWKEGILKSVNKKIQHLQRFKHPQKTSPVLRNPLVLENLKELHNKFVITPIDKAANNVAFICKRYYIERLLSEVGLNGMSSATYKISTRDPNEIILNNIELCEKLGLNMESKMKKMPTMYWIPKMHKKPIGARFIVASKVCSTKPISKVVSGVFQMIFNQVNKFHLKSKFYSNFNLFWVINNSQHVTEKLEIINTRKRARSISTYDFSTLYTKIPHRDLIKELNKIIDLVFEGGKNKFIGFTEKRVFWCNTKKGKSSFTRSSLKAVVESLICESYFKVGNKLLLQSIGIPMGMDPASFWANLYLHRYEYVYMSSLIRSNARRAHAFHGCKRYIDDMCCLNDGGEFENSYNSIYPKELELKCEHNGSHATFLDLDIAVEEGIFVYKLFDKRDAFPFNIVRMPHKSSEIPSYIFYGAILSEGLRIARATLRFGDFLPKVSALVTRMINQGGENYKIFRQLNKAMTRYPDVFMRYNLNPKEMIVRIKQYINADT
ncbi:hypothetical protein [Soonwooa purpurea]